jgi:type IV secretory pathway TrbL component
LKDREADYGEEAEVEGEEIQESETCCSGAQKEGDEEGKTGQEGQEGRSKKAQEKPGAGSNRSATGAATASSSIADLRGSICRQDRRSINTGCSGIAENLMQQTVSRRQRGQHRRMLPSL